MNKFLPIELSHDEIVINKFAQNGIVAQFNFHIMNLLTIKLSAMKPVIKIA